MLSIEKILGITGIERKWLETGKRTEWRGCPLPAIAG
jgi:hypothetical protein